MSQSSLFDEDETGVAAEHPEGDEQPEYADDELYKRWYRSRSGGGFISLRPWLEAGKIQTQIGELGTDNKLTGVTSAYCSALDLGVFTAAVTAGREEALYPHGEFVAYGGARTKDHGPVSRILKISPLADAGAFIAKCGLFEANVTGSGAFTPKMDKPIATNSIRLTRIELAQIAYRLDLILGAYVATHPWSDLMGRRRR